MPKSKKARSGPREGHGYPVKPAWQEDVKARLRKLGMTEKDLATKIGCAQSTMHQMLNQPGKQSALVPAIHFALGWDPPPDPQAPVPLPSSDAIEMAHMYDRLPEHIKRKMRDDAKFYLSIAKPDEPTN